MRLSYSVHNKNIVTLSDRKTQSTILKSFLIWFVDSSQIPLHSLLQSPLAGGQTGQGGFCQPESSGSTNLVLILFWGLAAASGDALRQARTAANIHRFILAAELRTENDWPGAHIEHFVRG
jgi:hypothetical protein